MRHKEKIHIVKEKAKNKYEFRTLYIERKYR